MTQTTKDFPDLSLQIGTSKPDPKALALRQAILLFLKTQEFYLANDPAITECLRGQVPFEYGDIRNNLYWLRDIAAMVTCYPFRTILVASLTDRGLAYVEALREELESEIDILYAEEEDVVQKILNINKHHG